MRLGRVIGSVWSTVKHEGLTGRRLLLVQPVTPELEKTGKPLVCADAVGCGAGELVFWVRGREASYAFLPEEVPADNAIVAIVDELRVKRPRRAAAPPGPAPGARGSAGAAGTGKI